MTSTFCLYFLERKPVHSFKMKVQTLEAKLSSKRCLMKVIGHRHTLTIQSPNFLQQMTTIQQGHTRAGQPTGTLRDHF